MIKTPLYGFRAFYIRVKAQVLIIRLTTWLRIQTVVVLVIDRTTTTFLAMIPVCFGATLVIYFLHQLNGGGLFAGTIHLVHPHTEGGEKETG
jgi:hypothetical protein